MLGCYSLRLNEEVEQLIGKDVGLQFLAVQTFIYEKQSRRQKQKSSV